MAETGANRRDATAIARSMLGQDAATVVLPEAERPMIRLALAVAGQWRMAGSFAGSHPIAFDMTAVDATARWLGIPPRPHLLDGLAIIEREALKLMRKR